MHVRQLVGRYSGQIVELPYDRARAAIEAGTAAPVEAELKPQIPSFHELPFSTREAMSVATPRPRGRPRKTA